VARLPYDTMGNIASVVWEARSRTGKVENIKLTYEMAKMATVARARLQDMTTAEVGRPEARKSKGHLGMKTTTPSLVSTTRRKLCTTGSARSSSLEA
jgi:hypothetical protein